MQPVKRNRKLEPDKAVTIGGLVTTLEFLINIFKIQRAIIEELKAAASKTLGAIGEARRLLEASFTIGEGARLMVRDIIFWYGCRESGAHAW